MRVKRERCPWCGRETPVTVNGALYRHGRRLNGVGLLCLGSGWDLARWGWLNAPAVGEVVA